MKLFRDASWLYPSRGKLAAWGVGAFLCLMLLWPGLSRAQTPAGTSITNVATATYLAGNVSETATSDAVQLTVGAPPGTRAVIVDPDRTVTATGGSTITLAHQVRNTGSLNDSFAITASSAGGWPVRIFRDLNGNGLLDEGEPEITGALSIEAGSSIHIILQITVPGSFTEGNTQQITVTATSTTDSSVTDSAQDTINGRRPDEPGIPSLRIQKDVDKAQAQPGEVLTYTIRYEATGSAPVINATITDSIPAALTYESGSLELNGSARTEAVDPDSASYVSGPGQRVVFQIGTLKPGAQGVAKFRARIAASAATGSVILNRARATFGQTSEREAEPATATTTVASTPQPRFDYKLTKRVVGSSSPAAGETVQYRIVATNLTTTPIGGLQVTDTLPPLLDFVSATPVPTVAQGRALSWTVGLASLDSAVILVNARVNNPASQATRILNTARAQVDTVIRTDTASILAGPGTAPRLEIALAARVLEVAVGQTATLIATVRNPGLETLDDIVVELTLPEGTRYVQGSISGAEFISVSGNTLLVRLPGTLAPGEAKVFTYAISIINPPSRELVNLAEATARGGTVASNEATVRLRLLISAAAQTSVVIGKAWADLDGNGRQDDGEEGLANIDIWTEDGAVARTDADGKFSFVNLRVGSHVFRADPTTIPAGYMLDKREDGMVRVRLTGWTSPRISMPVLPAPGAEALALRNAARNTAVPARASQVRDDDGEDSKPAPAQIAQLASASSGVSIEPAPVVRKRVTEGDAVSVKPALTPDERKAEESKEFLQGPGVQIITPGDGSVIAANRAFVIARAERDRQATLMLNDSVLANGVVRIDGVQEFAAIALKPGPNIIRVDVTNSWNNLRSDRVRVHVSGPVDSVVAESSRIVVPADGETSELVRVQLLDQWGVPVVNRPYLDVAFDGGTIVNPDASKASMGLQVQADESGWVEIEVKGGLTVGRSQLKLKAGKVGAVIPVEMIARARPLMLIGTGQVGFGASAKNYGALSVRGRVTDQTALTVSYDTRRLDDGRDAFRRTTDPLSDGIYPMLGDASAMRTVSAARGQISAKLERGLDHVSVGDVQTGDIAQDFTLARYSRSVTGAAARVSTGPVVVSAFGAATSQSLSQVQIRGRGVSGPYSIGRRIIPGTQQVQVELRDQNNAQNVLSRTPLVPYIDYEIDPDRGEIMLKRALPAADPMGNAVFLVVTSEAAGGGDRKSLWGVRLASDLGDVSRSDKLKGITMGASVVHDGQALNPLNLIGADIRFAPSSRVDIIGELAHSDVKDSSGIASSLRGTVRLFDDALTLGGRWSKVGEGFGNPSNMSLAGGTSDIAASAALSFGKGEAKLEHARQDFGQLGVSRNRTQLSLRQSLTSDAELEVRMADDHIDGEDARKLGQGEAKLTWSPTDKLRLWGEGRNRLYSRGSSENAPGGSVGAGLSYQALENVALELRHVTMAATRGSAAYSLTNFGVRSQLASGAQAWGSYQLTGGVEGARNAAVVGLNNTLRLTEALSVSGMFERRMGVERATADDPVRALPFPQVEKDYWSGALGLEYLPQDRPYRLSFKGERKDGQEKSLLFQTAGDVTLGTSFGILSRQEFSNRESGLLSLGGTAKTTHRASIWGLVWRPRDTDKFNTLMELRWVEDKRPSGIGAVDRRGMDERLSAALEAVWSPSRRLEIGSRYALRKSTSLLIEPGLPDMEQKSHASFLGGRADLNVARWLSVRGEARAMEEHRSSTRTWDVAPSLVLHPIQAIEIAGGKRWGTLLDQDFAANGGRGWFLTVGARVTEATLPTATAFWRNRFQR